MDADGTRRSRLTDNPGPDRAPNWDTGGDQLVFSWSRSATVPEVDLVVVDRPGGCLTLCRTGVAFPSAVDY